eukprot:m.40841 g.40841  ORF g.40841 m.40841 type:complete len:64 (+) comp33025_c0_seq11:2365-2556(+)
MHAVVAVFDTIKFEKMTRSLQLCQGEQMHLSFKTKTQMPNLINANIYLRNARQTSTSCHYSGT